MGDEHIETTRRKLTIYKRIFYQSDCYRNGIIIVPSGVQVHSTGANNPYLRRYVQPDDGRLGPNTNNNSHNQPGGTVCASAYIGKLADGTVAVYQTLPWDMRCWLSGSGSNGNANRLGFVGFEICEDGLRDRVYFDNAVMSKGVLLCAYLCQEYGISVDNVKDHQQLFWDGLASNHADITHWLSKYGLTMDDFRQQVRYALEDGVEVTYIDCDEQQGLYDAIAVNPGSYLNLRSGPAQTYASIARIPKGTIVMVLDDSNPEWWRVSYQGQNGYAMAQYLERIPGDPPVPEEPQEPEQPEQDHEPIPQGKRTLKLSETTIAELYDAIMESGFCPDARSGNVSDIDYQ